jgi:UbiD family decarboxylase
VSTAFQKDSATATSRAGFENVKGFNIPVVAGVLGASREIYALGLQTETVEGINRKWDYALEHPLAPRMVSAKDAPCKENILHGSDVDITDCPCRLGPSARIPAVFTSPYLITKDPETGVQRRHYRMQVKGKNKTGLLIGKRQDMAAYKNNAQNKPTPVAVVIGAEPTIGYVSVSKISDALDEFAVAGALRGQAVDMVPCETVPLEVQPAEIVLEGEIPASGVDRKDPSASTRVIWARPAMSRSLTSNA